MFTAIFAAVTALEQILSRKDDVSLLGLVIVVRIKLRSPEIIVHFAHVCKVNKKGGEGLHSY